MRLAEMTLNSKQIYAGKIINLRVDEVRLPNGQPAAREIVEHPGAVTVAALTDREELIMVRQFRQPVKKILLELPAGKLDPGEEPLVCAQRELREETGMQAGRYELVSRYYTTPGFSDEIMYLFRATELQETEQSLDEDEFIEVLRVPLTEARQMINTGEIEDAKTIIGILAAQEEFIKRTGNLP
ncbi:MAG: NUDIX hydrolase [Syntrophomonadaceae bacterium]|nr:NUDIX hydrolase [Syntrophomonadaceae bacterium]